MNTRFTHIQQFIAAIVLLVVVILLLKMDGCKRTISHTTTTVIYDSTTKSNTTFIGDTSPTAIVYKTNIKYIPNIVHVNHFDTIVPDTAAIIKAWLQYATYATQIIRDSDMYILIQDTIYQNTISWRKVDYKILRPSITNTTIITPAPRVKIYAGGQLALSRNALGLIPTLMVSDRKSRVFSIGYEILNTTNNQSHTIHVGAFFPITFKNQSKPL